MSVDLSNAMLVLNKKSKSILFENSSLEDIRNSSEINKFLSSMIIKDEF